MYYAGEVQKKAFNLLKINFSYYIPLLFASSFFLSKLLLSYWNRNINIMHTSLELICVFMELGSFVIFWITYRVNEFPIRNYLTFGFLIVTILDLMHVITFESLGISGTFNMNLSITYGLMGRFVEVVILFLISYEINNRVNNREITLVTTLIITLGCIYLTYIFKDALPTFYRINTGITGFKVLVEYFIIMLFIVNAISLRKKVKILSFISYRDILTGLIFGISYELCYTMYENLYSLWYLWGHLLKIIFYFYLFKGFLASSVIYPYSRIINLHIESEERYKSAFDNLTLGVALTDLKGMIVKANRNLLDILGYKEEELIGLTFENIIPEGDTFIDGKHAKELLENNSGKILLFEGRYRHKAGQDVWVKVNISLINNIRGNPMYFIYEVEDISSSKKVIELEMGMEKKVKQLSDALEYDKLRTEFFANLSHELRTPLNVITGALQLLEINLSDVNDEDISRNINYIKQNSRRLIRLINNLIDTTKIEAGFFQLNLKNYNIISLVEDITLSIAGFTRLKGIELIFDTEIEEKIIACDPDKIERIILNLLSNSIKFTEKGGSIYVTTYESPEGIVISIKDTGLGIPEDKQNLIFERFRQVDKTFTRNAEGSGIGLSLVKSLVELHGGKISLISDEGIGSEFLVHLPSHFLANQEEENDDRLNNDLERVERVRIEFSDIYIND